MAKTTSTRKKTTKKAKAKKPARVSYHRRPEDMQLDLWQLGLRKQFGKESTFEISNLGSGRLFSDFQVWNPATRNQYLVSIRSGLPAKGLPPENTLTRLGNSCSCQDFKTNRLGLCKHISAVLHKIEKQRGVKKALREGFRPPAACIYVDYRAGRRIRIYIGEQDEAALLRWCPRWFTAEGFLTEKGFADFETVLDEARSIQPGLQCTDDAFDLIAQQRERLRRQAKLQQLMPQGGKGPYLDDLVKVPLFPYQKTGAFFAARAGRCLIADEMGLGKTIQAIAGAELLRREAGIHKALVVCPTSLKYQWKSEIEKFSGAPVHIVEGPQVKRLEQYKTSEAFFHIASYNVAANDAEHLHLLDADLLIIDEAQRIKNFRTKVSTELKKVRTPYCFVLTGTPLENKLEELYAITQFVDQHKLPPLYRFLDRYQIQGDNGQVVGYKNLKEIGETLSDCMIRRLKREVLKELPQRMDKILFVPMTKEQKEIHRELGDSVARLVAKWRRFHYLNETDRRILMLCLSQMRMVADSTFILDQKTRFDTKIGELLCIFEEALVEPEQKIVIFSQWERMTRLVAQELEAANIGFANLHGGVPSPQRAELLERFREDPECRVFLSTDAGGVGLNLQSASLLINLDLPWNPAVLEQRIGRIHRMGQRNSITIINMVSEGSIEHRMLGVLEFKSSMAQGVLDPEGDDTIFMSESKFKKFMENVESFTGEGWQSPLASEDEAQEAAETEDLEQPPAPAAPQPEPAPELAIQGDDDVVDAEPAPRRPAPAQEREGLRRAAAVPAAKAPESPQELVQAGVSFFAGLAQTLSSPQKTQELVQSLVATDEETGQSYLKIPVENAAVVENAVKLLGGLLAGLGGKGQ